jgi:putative hemolysin
MPPPVRWFVENALHLRELDNLYREARSHADGKDLASALLDALGVNFSVLESDLIKIPATGPAVVVSNHPFGMLDGLVLDAVLRRRRPDVKVMANSILSGLPDVEPRIIPIHVFNLPSKTTANARYLRAAVEWLQSGGVLAVFPAGEVASWQMRENRVVDPPWSSTAARLARIASAPLVPAWFSGANSIRFQVAGIIHPNLRTAALPAELMNKRGTTCTVRFGTPLQPVQLKSIGDDDRVTDYVRAHSYLLAHRRSQRDTLTPPSLRPEPIARSNQSALQTEISALHASGGLVAESREYAVYFAHGSRVPAILKELGRLREITFRAAGEGTGRASDNDRFDQFYSHLVLWHKADESIAGSYRLAWTEKTLRVHGIPGLYTSTLFRYQPEFFKRLGPAVELGRSFVVPARQKEYAPLNLLWQGIAKCVAARPEAPVLFGAVSISNEYCSASREMMIRFLAKQSRFDPLRSLVEPRHPFRSSLTRYDEIRFIAEQMSSLDDLGLRVREIENGPGIPVLLRQYIQLGGCVLAFNLDRKFSDALDGLVYVDLRCTSRKLLDRYMGASPAAEFLARA